jgi:hypothetical protein
LIEDVTVSTTVAIARTYAGLIKPDDYYRAIVNNNSFFNLAIQMDCVKNFNNREGATVRLDPFQQIVDFKKYRQPNDWENYGSYDGNTYAFPCIISQFMNPVPSTFTSPNTTYNLPVIIEMVLWIEALLIKPSPLYLLPSPTDLNYEKIAEIISTQCEGVFPIVTKFNSFANFMMALGKLSLAASTASKYSTVLPLVKSVNNIIRARNINPNRRKGMRRNNNNKRKQNNKNKGRRNNNKFSNNSGKKGFKSARINFKYNRKR